jgi:hypothetical protein
VSNEPKNRTAKARKSKKPYSMKDEVVGNYWRAWFDGEKYYFEFDQGHFATKFGAVEISKEDFTKAKSGDIAEKDLIAKYSI